MPRKENDADQIHSPDRFTLPQILKSNQNTFSLAESYRSNIEQTISKDGFDGLLRKAVNVEKYDQIQELIKLHKSIQSEIHTEIRNALKSHVYQLMSQEEGERGPKRSSRRHESRHRLHESASSRLDAINGHIRNAQSGSQSGDSSSQSNSSSTSSRHRVHDKQRQHVSSIPKRTPENLQKFVLVKGTVDGAVKRDETVKSRSSEAPEKRTDRLPNTEQNRGSHHQSRSQRQTYFPLAAASEHFYNPVTGRRGAVDMSTSGAESTPNLMTRLMGKVKNKRR